MTAAMGAFPLITQSDLGPSAFQPVFRPTSPYAEAADVNIFNLGVSCKVSPEAELTYSLQVTNYPIPSDGGNWVDHDQITGKNTDALSNFDYSITAYRLNVTDYFFGSVTVGVAWW